MEKKMDEPVTAPHRSQIQRALTYAATVCVIGCIALAWHALSDGDTVPVRGAIAPTERSTVHIGQRGVAVVEPGASLSWELGTHGVVIAKQEHGSVFYRVNRGPAFEVRTPGGIAEVRAASFRVAVQGPDDSGLTVTVHEGTARFSDPRRDEQHEVGPGERLAVSADGSHRRSPAAEPAE